MKPARDRHGRIPSAGSCPTCGKVRYLSRSDARAARKRLLGSSHEGLNAYRCGEFWHLGTLPPEIRRGVGARDSIGPPRLRVTRWNGGR